MLIIFRVPILPVLCSKMIVVGPIPTSIATVIRNRANPRGMVVRDGLNMRMGRNSTSVAHPVPSLNKINVDED